ncbi:MAG: hypothetical protein E6556_05880 [Pantoea sp.]|nr:hypothetical protein [Pantoea sp.]
MRQHFMAAEGLIQHLRVGQEGVGNNTQFAAGVEVLHRAADQGLRRIQAGLASFVERRVREDQIEAAGHVGEDVAGENVTLEAVDRQRRLA